MTNRGRLTAWKGSSEELLGEMEVAEWEMIEPIATQLGPFGVRPHAGNNEGQHVWNALLAYSQVVALRCFEARRAEVGTLNLHRQQRKEKNKTSALIVTSSIWVSVHFSNTMYSFRCLVRICWWNCVARQRIKVAHLTVSQRKEHNRSKH